MGQNGKNSNNRSEKGNDDGKIKKRPFKVGSYRVNSALECAKPITNSNTRLTRSRSVEFAGNLNKQQGKSSVVNLQLPINLKKIYVQKMKNNDNELSHVQQSHSTGNITKGSKGIIPKKRQPFSFSHSFEVYESIPNTFGGGDSIGEESSHSKTSVPQLETRSPRVHFAEPLDNGKSLKSTEENSEADNKMVTPSETSTLTSLYHPVKNSEDNATISAAYVPEPEVFENVEKSNKSSKPSKLLQKSNSSISEDEIIIAQTDDLIMDVSRYFEDMNSTRVKQSPLNFSYSPNKPSQEEHRIVMEKFDKMFNLANTSTQSVEELDNIGRPSYLMMDSARSNLSPHFNISQKGAINRPASASFTRSVSNEDIHGRIALTIKMIEQEEQRELHHLLMKTSSIPDKLESMDNGDWNNIHSQRPATLSVSECGTQPSSLSSIRSSTLQQRRDDIFDSKNTLQQIPLQSFFNVGPFDPIIPNTQYTDSLCTFRTNGDGILENGDNSFVVPQQHAHKNTDMPISHQNRSILDCPEKETSNEKTKKLFSFLDQAEKADRETLLGLSHCSANVMEHGDSNINKSRTASETGNHLSFLQKIDSLISKGSVELAKEHIILERKFEESQQRIQILEETLIHQRELNMRNLRNSERDLKKRLRLQKEEFDCAFARNEALINEMVAEKRILLERCDKLMKNFDDAEEKYKDQIKTLQQKHLDEIKRLRKAQVTAESVKKQQWMGSKTQEIREMTVRSVEPEVQRIIQRHQQEMSEMRAWHADEIRETEERCQRKLHMQIQDMREKLTKEAEEIVCREKEQITCRFNSERKEQEDGFELIRRKLSNELHAERERTCGEELKLKQVMQESIRKAEIKGEIELDNMKQEYESKIANIERKHTSEIKSMKDIHEAETKTLISKLTKQLEAEMKEKENNIISSLHLKMENELQQRENRLKEEFEKVRKEEENSSDIRFKRMQEKFKLDLQEMDQAEKDLKSKFNNSKSQLLLVEEEIYSLRISLSLKEKHNSELQDANNKMLEERQHLTSVIRREFNMQIEGLENEMRGMRNNLVEIQAKHKLELEQKLLESERLCHDKDAELDKIGARVQQTIERKDETIQGLQKQLEKLNFQIQHLEGLLEEQRKSIVDNMTKSAVGTKRK